MAKEKEKEKSEPDTSYWESLGWQIKQSLGLWNASKVFEGYDTPCEVGGSETFKDLENMMQTAEEEYAKNTDGEQGLAVVETQDKLSNFRGEQVVSLDDSEIDENIIDAEIEDGKPKKQNAPHIFENLKVVLTKEQKEQKTSELLQVMNTKDQVEARFESVKKSHQAEVKDYEKQIVSLRRIVDSGTEWKDVECEQRFDYERGIVDIFRVDTGKYVRSRQMKDNERQSELFA